ncbi:surface-adhesin E family protein [Acinetobacter baumannii]|uniref:surface-adhesin E family protein n=1 Tax=Acinetobacter baumannii TaxID=470 RepID=UPI001A9270BC|nr:surface-adhesin E family protein [Acinetobacter baumannii]MBO0650568.1 hypothetical protein [Acinetobacter baumannii]MCT9478780.1 hypothetical protein [Acinetobacter baumannii]MCZ3044594.1 hypothetical protein [Acinetobacter baumannii]HEN9559533.1 hypothetical protein [Acinetobacter baumannii]
MKKLLISSLLLLVGTCVNAADWVELSSDQYTTVSVDADRIKYANKALDQRNAWVKVRYNRPDGPYKTGEYTLANQVIDCNNTKFSVSRVIGYNSKGQMKAQTPMNTGWMDIPPDSNFEYVAEAVCSYPHI